MPHVMSLISCQWSFVMYNGQRVMHMCVGVLGSRCCLCDPVLYCGLCNGHAGLVCWERVLCLCVVLRAVDVLSVYILEDTAQ